MHTPTFWFSLGLLTSEIIDVLTVIAAVLVFYLVLTDRTKVRAIQARLNHISALRHLQPLADELRYFLTWFFELTPRSTPLNEEDEFADEFVDEDDPHHCPDCCNCDDCEGEDYGPVFTVGEEVVFSDADNVYGVSVGEIFGYEYDDVAKAWYYLITTDDGLIIHDVPEKEIDVISTLLPYGTEVEYYLPKDDELVENASGIIREANVTDNSLNYIVWDGNTDGTEQRTIVPAYSVRRKAEGPSPVKAGGSNPPPTFDIGEEVVCREREDTWKYGAIAGKVQDRYFDIEKDSWVYTITTNDGLLNLVGCDIANNTKVLIPANTPVEFKIIKDGEPVFGEGTTFTARVRGGKLEYLVEETISSDPIVTVSGFPIVSPDNIWKNMEDAKFAMGQEVVCGCGQHNDNYGAVVGIVDNRSKNNDQYMLLYQIMTSDGRLYGITEDTLALNTNDLIPQYTPVLFTAYVDSKVITARGITLEADVQDNKLSYIIKYNDPVTPCRIIKISVPSEQVSRLSDEDNSLEVVVEPPLAPAPEAVQEVTNGKGLLHAV